MKKLIFVLTALFTAAIPAMACSVCKKQQPDLLQGITHGAGPQSNWDFFIIGAVIVIVVFTLVYSVKFLFWPGEQSQTHIKRTILNFE